MHQTEVVDTCAVLFSQYGFNVPQFQKSLDEIRGLSKSSIGNISIAKVTHVAMSKAVACAPGARSPILPAQSDIVGTLGDKRGGTLLSAKRACSKRPSLDVSSDETIRRHASRKLFPALPKCFSYIWFCSRMSRLFKMKVLKS